jgi:hypothetical protein
MTDPSTTPAAASDELSAWAERIIDAPPAAVYAILADYRTHHPRIMPPAFFSYLEVERGGVGEGTLFHITLRVGPKRVLHMAVAEPEPGRVLTETDLTTGGITTFTVNPDERGKRSEVRISSEWPRSGGLKGLVDRLMTPPMTNHVLSLQLDELERYVHTQPR